MSSRLGGALVAVLAVVVLAATAAMWIDFRHRVDDTAARTATDPGPASAEPTATPTPTPTAHGPVESLWIGDGYTQDSCGAAKLLGWACELDAEQGTGFLSDGTVFDPDNAALVDRLADLPEHEPDVVVVDAGRNDMGVFSTAAVLQAMDEYLAKLRETYPDATLVQIVPWTREHPTADPAVVAAVTDLMNTYDGYAVDPAGQILINAALAERIRALDLPVPVEK